MVVREHGQGEKIEDVGDGDQESVMSGPALICHPWLPENAET